MKAYDGSIPIAGELNAAYECELTFRRRFDSVSHLPAIANSTDMADLLRSIWPDDIEYRETFIAVMLDAAAHVIGYCTVSRGAALGSARISRVGGVRERCNSRSHHERVGCDG